MSRYPELAAKVDAFFARVQARHAADLRCDTGCSHCCHVRLSITGVEVQAIRDEIATWPKHRLDTLRNTVTSAPAGRCAALAADGRCQIYPVRPIVCRSHGAPIRLRDGRSLPVVTSCPDNFTDRGPAAADPDCIIDQATLSAMTLAVDREAGGDGARFDLAAVLADC